MLVAGAEGQAENRVQRGIRSLEPEAARGAMIRIVNPIASVRERSVKIEEIGGVTERGHESAINEPVGASAEERRDER